VRAFARPGLVRSGLVAETANLTRLPAWRNARRLTSHSAETGVWHRVDLAARVSAPALGGYRDARFPPGTAARRTPALRSQLRPARRAPRLRCRPEGSAPAGAARRSLSTASGVRPGRGGVIAMPRTRSSGSRPADDSLGDIGGVSTRPSEPGAPRVQSAYHRACGLYAIRTLRIAARPGVSAPGRGRVRDRELFGRSLLSSLVHAVRSGRWPWLGRLGGLSWRGPRRLRGNRRAVSAMLGQAS
jgi:hypothetical protein